MLFLKNEGASFVRFVTPLPHLFLINFSKNDAFYSIGLSYAVEFLPNGFSVVKFYAVLFAPGINTPIEFSFGMEQGSAVAPKCKPKQSVYGGLQSTLPPKAEVIIKLWLSFRAIGNDDSD